MNRDQSLALLNEYYYSRQQNAHTGDCVGHVQNIAEQILKAMVAADEIERMGLRIKTLECERDAWRESSDAYKADLVASDSAHEPCPVEAKERARNVHYALIEQFDLKDTPTANSTVRVMLERLAGLSPPPGESLAVEQRNKLAKYIVNRGQVSGHDHACAQCVPDSEILQPGFQCYFHLAEDICRTRSALTKGGEQPPWPHFDLMPGRVK
jgi:hypothetical protein